MNPMFINQYIVSEDTAPKYHYLSAAVSEEPETLSRHNERPGKVIRGIGLTAAAILSIFCLMVEEYGLMAVGLLLAAVYVYRIFFVKRKTDIDVGRPVFLNTMCELKWIRIIRFCEHHIEVEDPKYGGNYQYGNVIRRSEEPLYCTLWFTDRTSLRILKNGFITGTYSDFETFIDRIILNNINKGNR